MTLFHVLAGLITFALLVCLFVALFKPEKFE